MRDSAALGFWFPPEIDTHTARDGVRIRVYRKNNKILVFFGFNDTTESRAPKKSNRPRATHRGAFVSAYHQN